jgi:hypothetical protein
MSVTGWAPSSINCHISALAFAHKVNSWVNPTDNFMVKKLKEGCRRANPRSDGRLSITPNILTSIIQKLTSVCKSQFEVYLFRAAFLLAFFCFLRVGELTCPRKKGLWSRALSIDDVSIESSDRKKLKVQIRYSKTDQRGASANITMEESNHPVLCPFKGMSEYLAARPVQEGPLFIHFGVIL